MTSPTRDQPYRWAEGFYTTGAEELRSRLHETAMILGPVRETIPAWIEQHASELASAPVGFVSFDLDFYSSTVEAFDPPWAEQCFVFHCFTHPRYRDTVEAAPRQLPL